MATTDGSKRVPSFAHRIADRLGILLGQRDRLTPPARIFADPHRVDGSHDVREFVLVGENTARWLISQGLAHQHKVLEVGCGIGRMAVPLIKHLRNGGTYTGIDITAEKIDYCAQSVGRVAPHFSFVHADVYNKFYNPRGKSRGADYRFPFGDGSFHFVFLTSVFTHLLQEDMEHYVAEIARVLVPGGICIASFWITTAPLEAPYHRYSDVSWLFSAEDPEYGVYYSEDFVRGCYERKGLAIQTLRYGTWSGRKDGHPNSPQDVIIATKPIKSA